MGDEQPRGPYLEAIRRGFEFARGLGRQAGPVDLLVGISAGDGPAAAALRAGRGLPLSEAASAGSGAAYLHMQAQGAARSFADSQGQRVAPEHLLIALLDQDSAEVRQALTQAGLDPAAVRLAALAAIGAPAGQPPITLPPLTPAGTMGRPPLPAEHLDGRAWSVLAWRQDHLPVGRLRRQGDRQALVRLEDKAAWRIADRLGLDDNQRYSLISNHADRVEQRLAAAGAPGVNRVPRPIRRHRAALPGLMVGWGVWLGNRRRNLSYQWFRLRTLNCYRGQPPVTVTR